jgi:hypothetical protein
MVLLWQVMLMLCCQPLQYIRARPGCDICESPLRLPASLVGYKASGRYSGELSSSVTDAVKLSQEALCESDSKQLHVVCNIKQFLLGAL